MYDNERLGSEACPRWLIFIKELSAVWISSKVGEIIVEEKILKSTIMWLQQA